MSEMELYSLWCENATEDPDLQAELAEIKGNNDAINDRFYRDLEFGTGGLRGVIGAGTNRMNIYTVRRATQGFADYLNQEYNNPSVAISFDSRIKSDVFSKAAAEVLAANGIKVHIYTELMPTPCLSWAVRALKCQGGIMVTASHNPAKYNGYKVYGEDGCQITLRGAEIILEKINSLDVFKDVKSSDFEAELAKGNISYISNDVIEDFYKHVLAEGINTDLCASSGLKVVYTPLNGTGNKPVREILKRIGITDVTVVKEQENPDGNFTTCPYPNPEIREALQVGLSYCDKVKPDLLLATDPDCDRVGIAVPDGKGGYALFSGNEVGAMLLEYICQQRIKKGTMPKNPIAVKTIVTTDIVNLIGKEYGVEIIDVLTGFKFIGEQIGFLEAKGEEKRYIFGFEESYGYLSGSYVRDKDAVDASMLICEMAAYYRTQGITLMQARENMYKKYGMFLQTLYSFEFEGASGMKHMEEIMTGLRNEHLTAIGGLKVERFEDYKASTSKNIATGEVKELTLPKSNVLAFYLEGGCKAIVRPSGTEPKIKTYITAKAPTREEAETIEQKIYADFTQSMK
ncbi:phospho-sugar mutase [Ruminococcus flavefaciens]|uniref:phospho-sugar mutase n=1 Tax=Ruminococcus flavefaciens TaxID=1265 RepID=UPI0026F33EB9|nr:phospho-sugar mutase [Ruminococcus flavefaciens]MDD7516264.1 phospho-sugar mutase [Ruminococcus flavefaciens]MDY5692512.1 phospho-sugar mutase [Ruminococcus flavefaciens]